MQSNQSVSRSKMRIADNSSDMRGNLAIRVMKNGRVVDCWEDHNLIVNSGRNRMAELLNGSSTSYVSHIGVGSGTATEDVDDSSLTNQVLVPVSGTSITARTAHFDFRIDTSTANGISIREFGLFCGDGVMFSRRVRTGVIEKADDIEIEGYWEIHF